MDISSIAYKRELEEYLKHSGISEFAVLVASNSYVKGNHFIYTIAKSNKTKTLVMLKNEYADFFKQSEVSTKYRGSYEKFDSLKDSEYFLCLEMKRSVYYKVDKSLCEHFAHSIIAKYQYKLDFDVFVTHMKNVIDALIYDKTISILDAQVFANNMLEYVSGGFGLQEHVIKNLSEMIIAINAPFDASIMGPIIQAVNAKRCENWNSNGYSYIVDYYK